MKSNNNYHSKLEDVIFNIDNNRLENGHFVKGWRLNENIGKIIEIFPDNKRDILLYCGLVEDSTLYFSVFVESDTKECKKLLELLDKQMSTKEASKICFKNLFFDNKSNETISSNRAFIKNCMLLKNSISTSDKEDFDQAMFIIDVPFAEAKEYIKKIS